MVKIYSLKCPISNQIRYIGKTKQTLKQRLANHLCEKKRNHKNNWIKSLAVKNLVPIIELIEEVEDIDWIKREQFWISYYKDLGYKLCNLTKGGDGMTGLQFSEETRNKMSCSKLGTKHSQKTKDKIAKSAINRKVEQYSLEMTLINRYNSIKEASNVTKVMRTAITNCAKNRAKTAGGYVWKYFN